MRNFCLVTDWLIREGCCLNSELEYSDVSHGCTSPRKARIAFRGHQELLASEVLDTENFLEVLKFLSAYNVTMHDHLEKICQKHEDFAEEKKIKTGGQPVTNVSQ